MAGASWKRAVIQEQSCTFEMILTKTVQMELGRCPAGRKSHTQKMLSPVHPEYHEPSQGLVFYSAPATSTHNLHHLVSAAICGIERIQDASGWKVNCQPSTPTVWSSLDRTDNRACVGFIFHRSTQRTNLLHPSTCGTSHHAIKEQRQDRQSLRRGNLKRGRVRRRNLRRRMKRLRRRGTIIAKELHQPRWIYCVYWEKYLERFSASYRLPSAFN